MKKKKGVTVTLVACFAVVVTGLPFAAAWAKPVAAPTKESPMVLKLSHSLPATSKGTKVVMSNKFKELVEQRSGAKVKVVIHPGAELYKDPAGLVATAKGTIFSQVVSSDALTTWEKGIEILSMYGTFDDREHGGRFLAHENGGQEIYRRLEKKGLVVALYVSGPWMLWTKTRVTSANDLTGMKVRTTKSKMEAACMKALGCIVYPLPVSELYSAAQTGLVAGTVTLPLSIASRKLDEVFRFSVEKPVFNYNYAGMAVSKKLLDGMPSDIRKIALESLYEAADYTTTQAVSVNDNYIKKLEKRDVTFVTIAPAEWGNFHKRFKQVHEKYVKENPETFKALLEVVEETR